MEYKLLLLMIYNRGKVLTHNYIAKEIWGYGETGDTKNIRVFMANLRRKIERDPKNPVYLLNRNPCLDRLCGEGGIRTLGTLCRVQRFSKPALSATQAPLL